MTETLTVDVAADNGRYHRQELISWWDQERLSAAKVLVVGAGALGNELVKNLALLGVGTILVVDSDRVENSNLSRCVLFSAKDDGADKATIVAGSARRLNPGVTTVGLVGDVRLGLGLGVFSDVDLVLGGLDNREARLHVNQACWKTQTPWIDGAIEGLLGVVRVFVPPDSACYECTLNQRDFELIAARRACSLLTREQMLEGKVPTTVTSASVVAGMQTQEAIKLLHADRLDYQFAGKGFVFNGLTHDSYVVEYPRRGDCLSHDVYPNHQWTSVSADTKFATLLDLGRDAVGESAVLELEQDIVLELRCATCARAEEVMAPLTALTVGAGICPECEDPRVPDPLHTITPDDSRLLELTVADLGLPPADVITARAGDRRHFYRLGGPGLEALANDHR